MQSSNIPTNRVSIPFANSGTKNTIPNVSQIGITPGAASYTDGFPPLTFTPIAAGGVPPFGADFNGILNALSAWVLWFTAAGTAAPWNSTYSTAIGGYPKGALIPKATLDGFWLNTTDNNTTNPDTGGAGWNDSGAGRLVRRSVYFNNAGVQNVSVNGASATTTGANTFTALAQTKAIRVRMCGGGGGGGGSGSTGAGVVSAGGGGAAGSFMDAWFTTGFGSALTITVGAGGAGGAGASPGSAGGAAAFGTLITANGGGGGLSQSSLAAPYTVAGGVSGSTTTTLPFVPGGPGGPGQQGTALASTVATGGAGGQSALGYGGGGATATTTRSDGAAGGIGAGGGGSVNLANQGTASTGGAGGTAIIFVEEFS